MTNSSLDIIIIGGGGNTLSIIAASESLNSINIIGYTDLTDKGDILGIPYLGNEADIDIKDKNVVIGILYPQTPTDRSLRLSLIDKLDARGAKFPNLNAATNWQHETVQIGQGGVTLNKVIINAKTVIGKYSTLNTASLIEHGCSIGHHFFLGPNATVCGDVKIGNNVFIGANAVIKDSITIGDNITIGLGSVVTKDLLHPGTYVGNPAKIISS